MAFNLKITGTTLEKRLLTYLEEEKQNKEKKIRKTADILIRDELISFELSNRYIKDLRKLNSGDPFVVLLLAFFLADTEEWEESIRVFDQTLESDIPRPVAEDIRQLILLIRMSELNSLPTADELAVLLEAISSEENIVPVLWKLPEMIDAGKNPELLQQCVEKAKALYPDVFRTGNFQAWLFAKTNKIEPAIEEFSKVLAGLKKEDPDEPHIPIEMATANLNLAECYLLLPVPDGVKAMEYCNTALEHNETTGDPVMELLSLLTRAKAYLLPGDKQTQNQELALKDINRILEIDPQNKEALKLLQKTENQ
jgi:tetratricopeptide (TPR) repeat protein